MSKKKPIDKLAINHADRGRLVYDPVAKTGQIVDSTGRVAHSSLSRHPEKGTNVRVIGESQCEDLNPLFIGPPGQGETRRVAIQGSTGPFSDLRVLYVPLAKEMEAAAEMVRVAYANTKMHAPNWVQQDSKGGSYMYHGHGCIPGPQTKSYVWGTNKKGNPRKRPRPYVLGLDDDERKDNLLFDVMCAAGNAMGIAAVELNKNFRGVLDEAHHKVCRMGTFWEDYFMHPTRDMQLLGERCYTLAKKRRVRGVIPSHAVAVRLEGLVGLHCDVDDAPRSMPMIYLARRGCGRNKMSDLLVFENRHGGACLRIQTECPGHMCVVILDASKHLHANVQPPKSNGTMNSDFIRIVPCCKRGIDECTDCVAAGMPSDGSGGPEYAYAGQNWVPPHRPNQQEALNDEEERSVYEAEERNLNYGKRRKRSKKPRPKSK